MIRIISSLIVPTTFKSLDGAAACARTSGTVRNRTARISVNRTFSPRTSHLALRVS